ncbi:hypothetical protein IA57_11615 [Mangrovimonas yunxiaonensis]|uniref:Uncharacterized protein n=1 Tax=Mangrovimonas yunxiaonensis TaxID=1197477 RepID=A0A084THZ3_9FLAO|nr:hypothetical protein [Mangrovimonas yunxiaonensis]KFB00329.1 hypothetical protein IA57_11615 [Mangrovimonas yunxiaonensis]MBR9757648.1 hypothetical protein [Algicola sp.]GGH41751.1 hypothetical protein GCM10011364_12760 [Mangrovimonas yunxiaonensis]
MKRVIVDYKKITPEILELLNQKFPDGYNDGDIITFDNHHNETIEAVEVKTADCIYLVKISSKLHYTMANFSVDELEVNDDGHIILNYDLKEGVYDEEE